MSALSIRTNMRGVRRPLRVGATLAGIVIVLLATFLAILLGRGAGPVGAAHSQADCAKDTITLVASHWNDNKPACDEPARAKSAGYPAGAFER